VKQNVTANDDDEIENGNETEFWQVCDGDDDEPANDVVIAPEKEILICFWVFGNEFEFVFDHAIHDENEIEFWIDDDGIEIGIEISF
jgi:hypothetical protein